MSVAADVQTCLEGAFAGRRVVLVGEVVAGTTNRIRELRALGSDRCLVLAFSMGTGPIPDRADADVVVCEQEPARDVVAGFRQQERALANPPSAFVDALRQFDTDDDALVLAPPFAAVYSFAGREVYGARRPEWVALEDKARTDALLTAAGVAVPDYELVASDPGALDQAAERLDRGEGTVWAGDARGGFNGGGVFVRWVRDAFQRHEAQEFFASRCDRVRVATFTEGIPCSIHGFATADGVAVFRPVELVTLRSPGVPQFRYAGTATFWDPSEPDRETIRAAARRVGDRLRREVGFRGAFTVDGILAADGWVATECNPRFGAGLTYASAACADLRLGLLHHAVVAGDADHLAAAAIEAGVVPAADATRWGGAWSWTNVAFDETARVALRRTDRGFELAGDEQTPDGHLEYGPGPTGGFVRAQFDPARTPRGCSIAPAAVAALAFADRYTGSGFGPLTAARSVR